MDIKTKYIIYIYIGTVFYTIASYYHLSLKEWNLKKAYMIAIPIVLIEYFFSLQANRKLNEVFKISPVSIVLITMCFYFVNTWLLNLFITKNKITVWREILSFILIFSAYYITTNNSNI